MAWLWRSLYESAAMFWEVLWALVLGFALSGIVQVFVSKERMTKEFGRTNLRSVALATAFGAASSSCSYAAVAAAKTAFKKGAALIPTLAFMFASTNLVFELGIVLWLLLGWQFVLAEFVGAFVLIGVMWLLVRLTLPEGLEQEAREHQEEQSAMHDHAMTAEGDTLSEQLRTRANWINVSHSFAMDWSMLWRELLIGFVVAGFLSVLVPSSWWRTLFLAHSAGFLRMIENAVAGPVIALLSFVCSVGNIPLASVLWSGGISFGGVAAFIYGDLIVVPLIVIYRKYYGWKTALYITGVMFVSMVAAGIVVDLLFTLLHIAPAGPRPPSAISRAAFAWNYDTCLDIAALGLAALLAYLHRKNPMRMGHEDACEHGHAH